MVLNGDWRAWYTEIWGYLTSLTSLFPTGRPDAACKLCNHKELGKSRPC